MAGGVRVVAVYADRLRQRGHEVTVVSTPPRPIPLIEKLRHVKRGWGWPGKPQTGPSYLDNVDVAHRVIDRFRPIADADVPDADVVIATWWETAEWVAALSPGKGRKVFFIQHDESVFDLQPTRRVIDTWRLPLTKITISKWLTELAQQRDPGAVVHHIPNSVDMAQFDAPPRGKQARPTVGLLYSPVVFKGVDTSLKAVARVAERLGDVHLVTFGEVDPTDELPLPAGADHTTHPAQQQIRELYARCDVWLCGSLAEGFHLPPLEAMACRCPVVSTRVGGPMDIIEPGRNGYLADVGDDAALAECLLKVLQSDEAGWRAMSDAAYATATGYTWEHATDRFESALRQLAAPADRADDAAAVSSG